MTTLERTNQLHRQLTSLSFRISSVDQRPCDGPSLRVLPGGAHQGWFVPYLSRIAKNVSHSLFRMSFAVPISIPSSRLILKTTTLSLLHHSS